MGNPFRRRPKPPAPPPTPHEEAMAEEKEAQDGYRQWMGAARKAAGGAVIPGDLEGALQRAQDTMEARLIARAKQQTEFLHQKAIKYQCIAERNRSIAEAEQAAEARRTQKVKEAARIELAEGVAVLSAFLAGLSPAERAEFEAKLTEKEEERLSILQTEDPKNPGEVKYFLKKLRNLVPDARFEKILPREEDRGICKGICGQQFPFWDF